MLKNQHSFYLISEFFIALIGGFLLLAMWLAIKKQFKQKLASEIAIKRFDKGLLYLSLSIFVWAFSSLITLLNFNLHIHNWTIIISQNLFSILNSFFLILALYYLDNAPKYLYNNKKSTKQILLFFTLLTLLSITLALFFGDTIKKNGIRLNAIPDLILSCILSWFLVVSLYRTFSNRNMQIVAIIAVLSIVLLFLSQLPFAFEIKDFSFYNDIIKLISKFTLIAVFLVLGTSWVIELSQLPEATSMKISFTDWNQITLSIPSKNIINQQVEFGKKTTQFNNLLKFAVRRKFAPENQMCIEVFNGGEIPSQTYLSRFMDNLNAILQLENENKLHRNDLFTFIGQAKYRLRFLPEHITIDNALLNEFIENISDDYRQFITF